ncbi:hypothetical protein ACFPRL_06390 [Pseudoclavibacter helvolus]
MGVGGKDGHGLGADMTEVAVVVLAIERLETFAAKYLIELRERPRTVGPFVEPIGRAHQLVDEAAEDLWRAVGSVVRFGQHLFQHICHPAVAS